MNPVDFQYYLDIFLALKIQLGVKVWIEISTTNFLRKITLSFKKILLKPPYINFFCVCVWQELIDLDPVQERTFVLRGKFVFEEPFCPFSRFSIHGFRSVFSQSHRLHGLRSPCKNNACK